MADFTPEIDRVFAEDKFEELFGIHELLRSDPTRRFRTMAMLHGEASAMAMLHGEVRVRTNPRNWEVRLYLLPNHGGHSRGSI